MVMAVYRSNRVLSAGRQLRLVALISSLVVGRPFTIHPAVQCSFLSATLTMDRRYLEICARNLILHGLASRSTIAFSILY